MSERKKSYEERLTNNPILRERLDAILDIAENVDGKFETGDEAEEAAIEQLQRLGKELLHEWAKNREKQKLVEVEGRSKDIVGHGKKNSFGKPHSGK